MPKPKLLSLFKNLLTSKNKTGTKGGKSTEETKGEKDTSSPLSVIPGMQRSDQSSGIASQQSQDKASEAELAGGLNSSRTFEKYGQQSVSEHSILSSPPASGNYDSHTEPKQLDDVRRGNPDPNQTSITSDYDTMHTESINSTEASGFSGNHVTVIERPMNPEENRDSAVVITHSPGDDDTLVKQRAGEHSASSGVAPLRHNTQESGLPSQQSASVSARGGGSEALMAPTHVIRPFVEEGEREEELFPVSALSIPVAALRKSRHRLCLMLNIEQPLVDTDYPPDYTGLAEMLGFESLAIQNFWERNPSDTLFIEWVRSRDASLLPPLLKTLVECLQCLGRQDILHDCRGLILEDVRDYIAEQQLLRRYTVERLQRFDCYVNIAEQDLLTTGREILDTLEGVYGLRLCLTLRDVTLGGCPFDKMAEMLEERCDSKVVIVLTRSYEDSDACQFLTQFAVSLDPGSRRNKLIPLLVDEDIVIPRVLRCLAMLNYHRDKRLGFLWPRLRHAISQ